MTGSPMACDRCGETHSPGRCTGHVDLEDGTLRPCQAWPIRGGRVCVKHGGAAGQVRAAASRRLESAAVERRVARTLADLGEPVPAGDGEALLGLRDRYRKMVDALWVLVSELQLVPTSDTVAGAGSDGIFGRTFHHTGKATGEAKPHVLVVMLDTWTDKLAKLDEACVRLKLEDRRVRLEEAEVLVFAAAVDVMLVQVVPAELHGRCRSVLAGQLRALEAPKEVA